MKRIMYLFIIVILLIILIGCDKSNERGIEVLKGQYPEYFELSSFKGIEVYVWETSNGTYRCGMMSGTNRMKMDSEIQALEQKSLSITEAKMILKEDGIEIDNIFIIPITQPYENLSDDGISDTIIIDEECAEQIYRLFKDE